MRARLLATGSALLLLLAGCGGDADPGDDVGVVHTYAAEGSGPTRAPGPDWHDETPAAVGNQKLGGPRSDCPLPVTFSTVDAYRANAFDDADNETLGGLLREGMFTVRCEVMGRPSGHHGFIRILVGDEGYTPSAQSALEEHLMRAKDAKSPVYRGLTVAGRPAAEVLYQQDMLTANTVPWRRALAVELGNRVVLVTMHGTDQAEYEQMIPAYLLLRETLAVA